MRQIILAATLAVGLTTPALAGQCPRDIAKIDATLASSSNLPQSIASTVKNLRDTGERLHNSGKHAESVQTLAGAKDMLRKVGVNID